MGIFDGAKRLLKDEAQKPVSEAEEKLIRYSKIESLDDARKYLNCLEDMEKKGELKGLVEPTITTATSIERREFLNYAINHMPEKYIQHKILLFMRVNPYFENPETGEERYLSKKEIARCLSERLPRRIFEFEIDRLEKEAVQIAMEAIETSRKNYVPIVGNNRF